MFKAQLTVNTKSTLPETQIVKITFFQEEFYCPPLWKSFCDFPKILRAIVCKIQANGESDHVRISFFFIYVRDFHEIKLTKKFFFKNFIPYSFYGHVKLPLATIRFRNMF